MSGLLACAGAPDSVEIVADVDDTGVAEVGPTIEILAPDEETEAWSSTYVTLVVQVSDPDHRAKDLSVDWTSDLDGSLATAAPDRSGEAETFDYLTEGAHLLTATVTNPDDLSRSATVALAVGPSLHADLRLYAPTEGEVYAPDARIEVRGGVNSAALEPSEYDLSILLDDRDVLWTGHCDAIGAFAAEIGPFEAGSYQLRVDAQDPADRVGTSITIGLTVE